MHDIALAIDQGTTGTTAAFFDYRNLTLLATCKEEFEQIFPRPGWVEHDPEAIWRSVLGALKKAIDKLQAFHPECNLKKLRVIGITNQRETIVPWNRVTGEVAGNAIVWQDRRTADFCDDLKRQDKIKEKIRTCTGLVCDPYFSASKMRWIISNNERAQKWLSRGELVLGTIDAWLLFKLTGGQVIATEHANASRTMLYNLQTGGYDPELLELFGIPLSVLPEIRPSTFLYGKSKGVAGIPDNIPIAGILGDQQAALMGQGCTEAGEAKITYGTGAFLLMNTGTKPVFSNVGLLTTVACATPTQTTFAVEGAAFIAGAAVQFLRDNFGWVKNSAESQELALSSPRDENVVFIPAMAGLAAPYWNPNAKGVLFGLTRGTSKGQIARAVLEAIAIQNVQLFRLMEQISELSLRHVGVDGGASKNDHLMQFQADVLRVKLVRPENIETTAKGAVIAARMGLEPGAQWESTETSLSFAPSMLAKEAESIVARWVNLAEVVDKVYSSIM